MKEVINILKNKYPDAKINKSSRGKAHIRVTRGMVMSDIHNFTEFEVLDKYKDTDYSRSYITYFIALREKIIPIVISDRNAKINSQSILQKELTPQNLGIRGVYTDVDQLLTKIKKEINKSTIALNRVAKLKCNSQNKSTLKEVLINLSLIAAGKVDKLSEDEIEIIKLTKNSVLKDFGEILVAIHLLSSGKAIKVEINSLQNNNGYDLIQYRPDGMVRKVNIKSGSGSGQSLSSFLSEYQNKELMDGHCIAGSEFDNYIKTIQTLGQKKGLNGVSKTFKACEYLSKNNDMLGNILSCIKGLFFNGVIEESALLSHCEIKHKIIKGQYDIKGLNQEQLGNIYVEHIKKVNEYHTKKSGQIGWFEKVISQADVKQEKKGSVVNQANVKQEKKGSVVNSCEHLSFADYLELIILSMLVFGVSNKNNVLGVPRGDGSYYSVEETYKKENGLKNALLFTMSTLISSYANQDIVSEILNKVVASSVRVMHIDIKDTLLIDEKKGSCYKLHYWGNFKNPTNNILGIKQIS